MGFRLGGPPDTDDPNVIVAPVDMGQKQNPLLARRSDGDEPLLVPRMIRIVERQGERIREDPRPLLE